MKYNFTEKVIFRGGGDLGTASAHKLFRAGFKIGILELDQPLCIRRTVSFSSAIYENEITVENVTAKLVSSIEEFNTVMNNREFIPVIIDSAGKYLSEIKPDIFIDATLAKRNILTKGDEAPFVIGLGPGFTAGENCSAVIETERGHFLGRIITAGASRSNTGVPGEIMGHSADRVLRSPETGIINNLKDIGDTVEYHEIISRVEGEEVKSPLKGLIRGLIKTGSAVKKNQKIGDIDPRNKLEYIHIISDKGRTIAGGVLEAVLSR